MAAMRSIRNIVVLTGAGVSAESGIDTFRSEGGLWEQHRVEDVATPGAFARDPDLVLRFYDMRRAAIQTKEPNAAHEALARLDGEWTGDLLIVTQNVDDLHERAGAAHVLHMHGKHLNAWCTTCDVRSPWTGPLIERPACPACSARQLRPDVVWFGEMPYHMETIHAALRDCDLFVSIGTSGRGLSGGRIRTPGARSGCGYAGAQPRSLQGLAVVPPVSPWPCHRASAGLGR